MQKLHYFSLLSIFLSFCLSITTASANPLKIALVLDRGGKDDKSFNSAAFRGAKEAKEKLGIFLKEIEPSNDALFEPAMRSFAEKKFDLIIGVGVSQKETIQKLAVEMPQQKFVIIDAEVQAPNVVSLLFEEQEGSYLVGYIAAIKSKSNKVGFIGGMDIPLIRRFEEAYKQGAKDGAKEAHKNIEVTVNYIGVTSEAWNNPTKAKELAKIQYSQGVDVIFAPAGASNIGCFDAAEATNKLAIGVDSNQNGVKPGFILTSMLKRIDTAVFETIKNLVEQKFTGKVQRLGIKDHGIDWALDEHNKKLFSADELKKIETIKQNIISHNIKIKDYYKTGTSSAHHRL